MRSTKKKNIVSVLFTSGVLLISGLISGCGKDSDATAQNRDNFRSDTVAVQTQEVEIRDFSRSFRATGTLVARQRAMLRTIVGGLISDVPVDVGDRVEEGDLLMQIREIDYELVLEQTEADLARANAQLEQAEREQERTQRLYENGTASEQDLDQAMTAYNEAQAARLQAVAGRNTAQQNLEDASIRAPYNGVITEREFEPREFASSGEAAIEILNLELLEAELEIPEKYLGLVEDSSQVLVEFESGFEPRTGTIVAISPKVGEETRSFRIRVQVRNDNLELPSGQFISTIMELRNVTDQIAIPQNALVRRDGQSFVWVYNEGIAERRPIREGIQEEQWVLIQNGVRQGEKVITEGKNGLNDNYPVREVSGSN